jgi:hypothetical protein
MPEHHIRMRTDMFLMLAIKDSDMAVGCQNTPNVICPLLSPRVNTQVEASQRLDATGTRCGTFTLGAKSPVLSDSVKIV